MHTVCLNFEGQLQVVVDDEGYARFAAKRQNRARLFTPQTQTRGFVPVLQQADAAGDRMAYAADKDCCVDLIRRDRVQPAYEALSLGCGTGGGHGCAR